MLAQKLLLAGEVSRTSLDKVEAQLRWASDMEILSLAMVLEGEIRGAVSEKGGCQGAGAVV